MRNLVVVEVQILVWRPTRAISSMDRMGVFETLDDGFDSLMALQDTYKYTQGDYIMQVLALNIQGTPRRWISPDEAIFYHATESVAWHLGEVIVRYHGGMQKDGIQSYLESNSIIAIKGNGFQPIKNKIVVLSNRTLFGRDRNVCAYCGGHFPNYKELSRDHIVPTFLGGLNVWNNVVTSCRRCNSAKGHKTLKEAGMTLLYVPYAPTHAEALLLQNRNILADQMEYLMAGIPKYSRLRLI